MSTTSPRPGARPGPPGLSPVPALHASLALFALTSAVGLWVAPDQLSARGHVRMMAAFLGVYVALWLGTRVLNGALWITAALSAVGAVAAVYFLTQYRFIAPADKVPVLDALGRALATPFPRIGAWQPFPNSLGTFLDGLAAAAAGLAFSRRAPTLRVASALGLALMLIAAAVAASRGSWFALAGVATVAALVSVRVPKPPAAAVALAAAGVVLAVVFAAVSDSHPWWLTLAEALGRPDRIDVYDHALTLLADTPFTGIGGGSQFAPALSSYAMLVQVPFLTYSHNLMLDVWLEQGLPGLAAWWTLAAATAAAAVAGERAGLGWRFRGVWLGLLAIHLHGLVDARQSVDAWTWAPFFALTAVLAGQASRHRLRVPAPWALAPIGVGLAVVLAVVTGRGTPTAAWHANLGAIAQARAQLGGLDTAEAAKLGADARRQLETAVASAPSDAPALRRLGLLHLGADRPAEAVGLLRRAWLAQPRNRTTTKAYGLAAMWTGDLQTAVPLLASAPDIVSELNAWSHWRTTRGELALALAASQASLALQPGQDAVRVQIADIERQTRGTPAPPERGDARGPGR